jgi:folylpolyglutamate synthase
MPKVIHVAGSKGKGTTCLYCNHILQTHTRKKIGCYTSPHQTDVRERILIDGEMISKTDFALYVQKLHQHIQDLAGNPAVDTPPIPGYPGMLALLAICIFIRENVDVIILETGIGGTRDSTNVFPHPVATGITTIGLDHIEVLGDNLPDIARHKAGIFKPKAPAFTVEQDEKVLEVLRSEARNIGTAGELHVISECTVREYGIKVVPNMRYQRLNACLAIKLAMAYFETEQPEFPVPINFARSLDSVKLPGRSQVISDKVNNWFISIAHNEISLKETMAWFQALQRPRAKVNYRQPVLIFNQNLNTSSPRDPYLLLQVIKNSLDGEESLFFDCVIFCTDQSDEFGEEKPGMFSYS